MCFCAWNSLSLWVFFTFVPFFLLVTYMCYEDTRYSYVAMRSIKFNPVHAMCHRYPKNRYITSKDLLRCVLPRVFFLMPKLKGSEIIPDGTTIKTEHGFIVYENIDRCIYDTY